MVPFSVVVVFNPAQADATNFYFVHVNDKRKPPKPQIESFLFTGELYVTFLHSFLLEFYFKLLPVFCLKIKKCISFTINMRF